MLVTCRLLWCFEVEDLSQASPATVSSCWHDLFNPGRFGMGGLMRSPGLRGELQMEPMRYVFGLYLYFLRNHWGVMTAVTTIPYGHDGQILFEWQCQAFDSILLSMSVGSVIASTNCIFLWSSLCIPCLLVDFQAVEIWWDEHDYCFEDRNTKGSMEYETASQVVILYSSSLIITPLAIMEQTILDQIRKLLERYIDSSTTVRHKCYETIPIEVLNSVMDIIEALWPLGNSWKWCPSWRRRVLYSHDWDMVFSSV